MKVKLTNRSFGVLLIVITFLAYWACAFSAFASPTPQQVIVERRVEEVTTSVEYDEKIETQYVTIVSELREIITEDSSQTHEFVSALIKLAEILEARGKLAEAEKVCAEAIDRLRGLVRQNPEEYEPTLAVALNLLGVIQKSQDCMQEATAAFRESIALGRKLAQDDPQNFYASLTTPLLNLANCCCSIGQYDEAKKYYQESVDYRRKLAKFDPQTHQPGLAKALARLALSNYLLKRYADVSKDSEEAIAIFRELAADNPKDYRSELADALRFLALAKICDKKFSDADEPMREANELYQALASEDPDNYDELAKSTGQLLAAILDLSSSISEEENDPKEDAEESDGNGEESTVGTLQPESDESNENGSNELEITPTIGDNESQESELFESEAPEEIRVNLGDLQVGGRIPSLSSGDCEDCEAELYFADTPHSLYTLSYQSAKKGGVSYTVSVLRPNDWLSDQGLQTSVDEFVRAQAELAPQYHYESNESNVRVWIDFNEIGCAGWATLVNVDNSYEYQSGDGALITGMISRDGAYKVDLLMEGQDAPVSVFSSQTFWSVDHNCNLTVNALRAGEQIRMPNGETKRIVGKSPRAGAESYNFEVLGNKLYSVAPDGKLAENSRRALTTPELRRISGFASGTGQNDPVVSAVASRLAGRQYKSFNELRSELWIAVAEDASLCAKYGLDFTGVLKGRAPYAPEETRVGKRIKYELHHLKPIKQRGAFAVYDLDNLRILDPRAHIEAHRKYR